MAHAANSRWRLGLAAVLAVQTLLGELATAQPTAPEAELTACVAIERDADRLACYDALALPAETDGPSAGAEPTSPAPAADSAAAIAAFGSELLDNGDIETPNEIHSRLVGEFAGWRGATVFRLENGQVWRQADEARLNYNAQAPMVTIRRGAFNSYRLSVDGINATVRVRRVE